MYDDDGVAIYRLDIALPELLYAAEYDGEELHTSDEDRAYDARRRTWCATERHWIFEVFTKDGCLSTAAPIRFRDWLAGFRQARTRTLWTPYGRAG